MIIMVKNVSETKITFITHVITPRSNNNARDIIVIYPDIISQVNDYILYLFAGRLFPEMAPRPSHNQTLGQDEEWFVYFHG